MRERLANPEIRAKLSADTKQRYERDPKMKDRIAQKMKATWSDPEFRERILSKRGDKERMTALWSDPVRREAQVKSMTDRVPIGTTRMDRNGYVIVKISDNEWRHQHRHVMSEALGRPLDEAETVHHINGNRADNRLENLELWSSAHPYGQRVADLVKWAREILTLYGHLFPAT